MTASPPPPAPGTLPSKWPLWLTLVVTVGLMLAVWAGYQWWFTTLSTWLAWATLGLSTLLLCVAVYQAYAARPAGAVLGATARIVLLGILAAVALAWVVAGFRTRVIGPGTPPPPPGLTDPTNPQQLTLAVQYGNSLSFDSVTHRAADERFLTILDTVTIDTVIRGSRVEFRPLSAPRVRKLVGPRAKIVPQTLAFRNDIGDISPGAGRIVARIYVDPTYQAPNGARGYPPLNLPPGLSYLWIDSLRGDSARVVIIPAGPDGPQLGVRLGRVHYHTELRPVWETYSRAAWRFSFEPNDPDCYNITCPWGCCDNCRQD